MKAPEDLIAEDRKKKLETKPQLHYSALDMLWRCGIQFEFRYVQGLRRPPTSSLHVGRAVDVAANTNLENKIQTDLLLPTSQVIEIARDVIVRDFANEDVTLMEDEVSARFARDRAIDKAVRLTRGHSDKLAPYLKPKAVQVRWSIEIPGFPFEIVGQRDLDELDESIHDLKTGGKTPNGDAAETSDQLTMYALSKYVIEKIEPPIQVVLDAVVDLKKGPAIATRRSNRTRKDFQVIVNRVENAAQILDKGAFTPARQSDWWCSLKYCPYASQCRYFRQPKSFVLDSGDWRVMNSVIKEQE